MSNYGGNYGGGGGGYGQQDNNNRYGAGGNPYDQRGNAGANPYAQQQNPYTQQQNPYAQQQQSNPYAQQGQQGAYGAGNDVEMGQMNGGHSAQSDPNAILNECTDVNNGISSIRQNLQQLRALQSQSLEDPDASQNTKTNRELDALSTDTMNMYRNFTQRVKKIKGMPGAGSPQNAPQVGRVERNLKEAIQQYQQVDAEFRKKLQEQLARQYKIVRPEASPQEVQEACEDTTSTQVFSQALLQSDRRGQSQSALRAVQGRHEAIQKIERQVIELSQLFQDMNALVVQQEPVVERINEQSENVNQDVTNANTQLTTAVKSARAARKKKWICLGITLLILAIIAIVLGIIFGVVKPGQTKTN